MSEKHWELVKILQKYSCPEYGTMIVDEISELFNYPKTEEE